MKAAASAFEDLTRATHTLRDDGFVGRMGRAAASQRLVGITKLAECLLDEQYLLGQLLLVLDFWRDRLDTQRQGLALDRKSVV